jgi:hypothetical protein
MQRVSQIVACALFYTALIALAACADTSAGTAAAQDSGAPSDDVDGSSSGAGSGDGGLAADSGATDTGSSACGEQQGARPSRRSEHMGAFDPVSGKLVIFGGSFAVPVNCGFPASTFETETWVYDKACDLWHLANGKTPPARARGMSALRTTGTSPYLVITGGRYRPGKSGNYTFYDDLWAFDFKAEKWLELSQSKTRPPARVNATMTYSSKHDALLMFGGNTSKSGLQIIPHNDLWQYTFSDSTWSKLQVAGPPSKRLWTAGLWDPKRERMVAFGGGDASAFANTAKYFNDLWAFKPGAKGASWSRLDTKSGEKPDARFWAAMTYDSKSDRYLMFGGHDDKSLGNRNDLWAFSPDDGQWLGIYVGDVPNKPANGQCSFPPDFTKMDGFSPERRYAGVFSAGTDSVWLHGGKTDCGVIDDMFRLDLKTYKWHEVTGSTVGNSCLRKGGLTCNDYCF